MKFSITVTLKKDVLDPQGKVVQNTLMNIGLDLKNIRQGKYFEIDVDENEELYDNFSKKVDNEFLPAIIVGKTVFVPEKSFKTINEAVKQIKNHL